jgi:hypothetical protein
MRAKDNKKILEKNGESRNKRVGMLKVKNEKDEYSSNE